MKDLNNLITSQIEGNYYNGELLGLKLIIDKNTGYFNATKLCKSAGRQFHMWKELHSSKSLINFVASKGIDPMYHYGVGMHNILSGVYACEELLLNIVSWAYPEYYLKFNNIVIFESEREKFFETEDDNNGRRINNKLDRILFQIDNVKIDKDKTKNEDSVVMINDKLDKILFQLEKRPKPTIVKM